MIGEWRRAMHAWIRGRLGRMATFGASGLDPFTADERPAAGFERGWRAVVKRRVVVVMLILGGWAAAIEARLVYLQVYRHAEMVRRADRQQNSELTPPAPRGDIVDRQGRVLAVSVTGQSIAVAPQQVEDKAGLVRAVCRALGDCTAETRRTFAERLDEGSYFYLRRGRRVSPEQADRIAELRLPGLQVTPEPVRYYPQFDLAAHLIGFVGVDSQGLGGVEHAYDGVIAGRPGKVLVQVDAHQKGMQRTVVRPTQPGATLELTIDVRIQHVVEQELRAAVLEHRARGGTAIVMDPWTGAILALANYPTFNPNALERSTADDRRNRAVQDVYEPGSTFKIVAASAAIEEGLFRPQDVIDCSPGALTLPGRKPITEASGRDYGPLSFEDVLVKSSNVGAVKVGLRIGADRMDEYVRRFGFGRAIGRDLRGESAGKVWSRASINDSALASISMGYQVSVTALQMAAATSAIANGGVLLEPYVVAAVARDGERDVLGPRVIHRVIQPATAATVTGFMEGVVERGTGTAARLDRYQVAGKTGTSHKAVPGGYSETDYNASFVGFAPSRRPAATILVVIDTPRAGRHYGGEVAAPVFKRIAEAALSYLAVPPTLRPLPPVLATAAEAYAGGPRPARAAEPPVIMSLAGRPVVPDLRGLSLRDAVRRLSALGLQVLPAGDGIVTNQFPAPGAPIEPGGAVQVHLDRVRSGVPGGHP